MVQLVAGGAGRRRGSHGGGARPDDPGAPVDGRYVAGGHVAGHWCRNTGFCLGREHCRRGAEGREPRGHDERLGRGARCGFGVGFEVGRAAGGDSRLRRSNDGGPRLVAGVGLVMGADRRARDGGWCRVDTGAESVAVVERFALGTTARLAVWPVAHLGPALEAADRELDALDRQASRFRGDSEISQVARSTGSTFLVSDGLAEAIEVALWAARWTEGRVDPTVGESLVRLGYDRDFVEVRSGTESGVEPGGPVPGWRTVRLRGRLLEVPRGTVIDLGATAKGLGADRAAGAALAATDRTGGVLVDLGGDLAVAGRSPSGGWPVLVTEDPAAPRGPRCQVVRLPSGALATSSVVTRRWRRGGRELHHLIDPGTGSPATGPWRTATVAAPTCAMANAAATAVVVGGASAVPWLRSVGLPARLVGIDGAMKFLGAWPRVDDSIVDVEVAPPCESADPVVSPSS